MGESSRRRVREHFGWASKGEFMRQLLDELDRRREPTDASGRDQAR
jgi:hypothetical protein